MALSRKTLGLEYAEDLDISDEFLASLLRRSAGIYCPCSPATLTKSVEECLFKLTDAMDDISSRLAGLVDLLIVAGDLLELGDVSTDDDSVKGTWLFAAPPSYVSRPEGSIFLCGVVPDQDMFLPPSLSERVQYRRALRIIEAAPGEDLAAALDEHGLRQSSEASWIRAPRDETPEDLLGRYERMLDQKPPSGPIAGLQILDRAKDVRYYRGRWRAPASQTGSYVARRPQEFGADLWCFVRLEKGTLQKLTDLPLGKWRWRGCDAAWLLQLAIDHCAGHPQIYRRTDDDGKTRLDFFSPLPLWAQRRLEMLGCRAGRQKSLLSYELPAREADREEEFLKKRLWMTDIKDPNGDS